MLKTYFKAFLDRYIIEYKERYLEVEIQSLKRFKTLLKFLKIRNVIYISTSCFR